MIREFNYTQRKRIESRHLNVQLLKPLDGGVHSFNLDLNLEDLQLPPDAPLVVEASRGSSMMRFRWGTVGCPEVPDNRELSEVGIVPNFRVMALSPDDSRRILALADRVRPAWQPEDSPGPRELIYLSEEDLGQEIWKLDLGHEEDLPVLRVNSRIDGISRTVRQDPAFRSLVFPEVVRAVLTKALLIEGADPGDEEGYLNGWLGFVSQFYSVECPGTSEFEPDETTNNLALQEWIEGALVAFTQNPFKASDIYAGAGR